MWKKIHPKEGSNKCGGDNSTLQIKNFNKVWLWVYEKVVVLRLGTQDVNGEHFTRNKGEEVTIFIHKIHNG